MNFYGRDVEDGYSNGDLIHHTEFNAIRKRHKVIMENIPCSYSF